MDTSERILLALGDIKEDIGGLAADVRSLDRQLVDMKQAFKDHVHDDEKVTKRVSVLEHARSRATGYVLALSAVGGIATTAGVAIAKALL